MKIKKTVILIVLYLLNTNVLHSIEADIFVQSTVNRASKILSDNISKEEKVKKLKSVAEDTVDIKGIGFYTLGSTRKLLSEEQKSTYEDLFRNGMKGTIECYKSFDQSVCKKSDKLLKKWGNFYRDFRKKFY